MVLFPNYQLGESFIGHWSVTGPNFKYCADEWLHTQNKLRKLIACLWWVIYRDSGASGGDQHIQNEGSACETMFHQREHARAEWLQPCSCNPALCRDCVRPPTLYLLTAKTKTKAWTMSESVMPQNIWLSNPIQSHVPGCRDLEVMEMMGVPIKREKETCSGDSWATVTLWLQFANTNYAKLQRIFHGLREEHLTGKEGWVVKETHPPSSSSLTGNARRNLPLHLTLACNGFEPPSMKLTLFLGSTIII